MAEDNVVVAFQPLAKAIDDLIAEYGADRPDHQYQPLMLPMIDVKRIRAAIATQAHEPSADVVERVARIINPGAWSVMDAEKARMLRKYAGQSIGWPSDQFQHKESMAMATAAIAAMRPERSQTIARTPDGLLWAYSGSDWRQLEGTQP